MGKKIAKALTTHINVLAWRLVVHTQPDNEIGKLDFTSGKVVW